MKIMKEIKLDIFGTYTGSTDDIRMCFYGEQF